MSIFVRVTLNPERADQYQGYAVLLDRCPVDVFVETDAGVAIDDQQVDECTFCGICTELAPEGVHIEKLYLGPRTDEQEHRRA